MMNLERLDWILYKQRDIVHQMATVIEKAKKGETIEMIGIPPTITAEELISFLKDRYNILDIAKNYDEDRINKWIAEAKNRLVGNVFKDWKTGSEIELLEGCRDGQS